jgi:hypothetical protein
VFLLVFLVIRQEHIFCVQNPNYVLALLSYGLGRFGPGYPVGPSANRPNYTPIISESLYPLLEGWGCFTRDQISTKEQLIKSTEGDKITSLSVR